MRLFSSEIVADARNIELEVFRTEEQRRQFLIAWFNEHVAAGGLGEDVEPLASRSSEQFSAMMIEEVIGRPVILGEVYL